LSQLQRRDKRDSFPDYRATSKNVLLAERLSRCPLEPVLGGCCLLGDRLLVYTI